MKNNNPKNISDKTVWHKNKWVRLLSLLTLFAAFALTLSLTLGSACIFYLIFGLPCPACGMTRANILAITFHFSEAFAMHPLFYFSGILFVCVIATTYKPEIAKTKWYNILCILTAMAFIITYIVRMVLFYPSNPPLVYNENSLLWLIVKWIRSF